MSELPFGDKLPVEMQVMIFGFMGSDMVLESRLVCKNWKTFVDEFVEPKIWQPYFMGNDVADNLLYFMGTRTPNWTKFTNTEQLEEMMLMEYARYGPLNQDESQQVESTCRQLIVQCKSVPDYTMLCQVFPSFVARFGYFIEHCVYFVHDEVPQSVNNIPAIFSQMTKIQSLVIYCQCWSTVKYWLKRKVSHNNAAFQLPSALRNLTVRGDKSYVFLSYLFTSHCPRVKKLKLWGLNYGVLDDISTATLFARGLRAFPNVEDLKLYNLSISELLALARWPVKRLSLKRESNDSLGEILESIQKFAGTLEYLHFHIKEEQVWISPQSLMELAFPNVHELRIPYFTGIGSGYLTEIKKIFPNIKHLQLVDNGNQIQQPMLRAAHNNNDPLQAIKDVLVTFWRQLPDGLEMISFRYRKYNNNNGGVGGQDAARRYPYTVHKYYEKKERQVPLNCN